MNTSHFFLLGAMCIALVVTVSAEPAGGSAGAGGASTSASATSDASLPSPMGSDTDEDGISDWDEVYLRGSDPKNPDTDGDGVGDAQDGWPRHAWITTSPLPEVRYAVVKLRDIGWPANQSVSQIDDAGNVLGISNPSLSVYWQASTQQMITIPLYSANGLSADGHVLGATLAVDDQDFDEITQHGFSHIERSAAAWSPGSGLIELTAKEEGYSFQGLDTYYWRHGQAFAMNRSGVVLAEQSTSRGYYHKDGDGYISPFEREFSLGFVLYPSLTQAGVWLGPAGQEDLKWMTIEWFSWNSLSPTEYNPPLKGYNGVAINDSGVIAARLFYLYSNNQDPRGGWVETTQITAKGVAIIDASGVHEVTPNPPIQLNLLSITSGQPVVAFGTYSDLVTYYYQQPNHLWWGHQTSNAWVGEEIVPYDFDHQTLLAAGQSWSGVSVINDRLEIVGNQLTQIDGVWTPVPQLIRNGVMRPVASFLSTGWSVTTTNDINNHGVILANATRTLDDQGQPITNPQPEPVLLVPVELTISHPVVESEDPPQYIVNADIASVELTASVLPAADGTVIAWEIETGSGTGSLSHAESLTVDGFAKTTLTTATTVGATYRVTARVKKLILPDSPAGTPPTEFDFDTLGYAGAPHLRLTTAEIKVVPGFAAATTVTRENAAGEPATGLPADGASKLTLVATVRDAFGQIVAENTPVTWHLAGLGKLTPITQVTDAEGKARASLAAGYVVADQKVGIEADGFEVTETIPNTVVASTLASTSPTLDLATGESTTLTASFPGVLDGTPVSWFTSMGEVLNPAATVQNGQATATLRASSGRTGTAHVIASIDGSLYTTQVPIVSSAPISIQVDHPVIVGDAPADGFVDVPNLDGTTRSVAYRTSTPVHVKAPGYPGYTATVRFGEVKPATTLRYPFDQVSGATTPDESGSVPATVSGATLDTTRHQQGVASLHFNGDTDVVGIADHPDLKLQDGLAISVWAYASAAEGSLVSKAGEYDLFVNAGGHAAFSIVTSAGTQTVLGPLMPTGRWVSLSGQYTADGSLKLTVDGVTTTAAATGTAASGTAMVLIGDNYTGWLDVVTFDLGRQFVPVPGLSVTGLDASQQVVLDSNGEATLTLAGGGSSVDADNPILKIGVDVSINPHVQVDEAVIVTNSYAYAVLDATMGDVRIRTGSTDAPPTAEQRKELVAGGLRELARTGQRASALLIEPGGNLAERQRYGFHAALWLETVNGAEQIRLVLENVDRLNLTSAQEVQLQEQVTRMLLDAIKGRSDAGANEHFTEVHGGLLATLAELSSQPSFQAFTTMIDGREAFINLADIHEAQGAEVVKDLAKLAQQEAARDPGFMRRVLASLKQLGDLLTTDWNQVAFQTTEDFLRTRITQAIADGNLTAVEGYAIGFGWGLAGEAFNAGQMANAQVGQRMAAQMTSTVIAALQGSQEAREALKEMLPIYGTFKTTEQANILAEEGLYFDAGKASAQASVASTGDVTLVIGAVKAATSLRRLRSIVGQFPNHRMNPIPSYRNRYLKTPPSFGKSTQSARGFYKEEFFKHRPDLAEYQGTGTIEVHHAVPQTVLDRRASMLAPGETPFTWQEIDSFQNTRGITRELKLPNGDGLHATITKKWENWFREKLKNNQTFTRQELFKHAEEIDKMYGHLFL